MVQRVTRVSMVVGLMALLPMTASGEQQRRVVFLPAEDAAAEAIDGARERLSTLGEVVDLPAPAPVGPSAETRHLQAEASASVDRARAMYYEAALDEAAEHLESFVERSGPSLAERGCFEELRTGLLWLGAATAKGGRHDEALDPFVLAIRLGLDEIDRSLFPPEVTRAFEAALIEAAEARTTTVTFDVNPEGSTIEVDGQEVAVMSDAAVEQQLAVGRHVVVARRPGYQPAAQILTLGSEATTIEMSLEPADETLISEQVAILSRDAALDPSDPTHIALLAQVTSADLVAVVSEATGTALVLYDSSGQLTPWPATPSTPVIETPAPPASEPAQEPEARPAWRRWWFWLALIGGAAVAATAIGLGVHFGTQNRDTFTLVVAR